MGLMFLQLGANLFQAAMRRITAVSLRVKIAGMVTWVVLAVGLTASLVVRANLADSLSRRLDTHALTVARAVAAYHADAMSGNIALTSHRLIAAMVESDPEMLYAVVYDGDGRVVVQVTQPGVPQEILPAGQPQAEVKLQTRTVETSLGQVREAAFPVEGMAGYVLVGLSEAGVDAALATTNRNLAIAVGAALFLAVSVSLSVTQLLTRPILALQRAVRSTSLANLPGRTEPQMDDEIGELVRAFNRMTTDLACSRDALVAQNRELAVLNATARAISGSLDLERILHAALDEILEQMNLQAGWIFLTAETRSEAEGSGPRLGQPLNLAVQSGLSKAFAREEAECDFEGCVCLDVLASGRCRVILDIYASCPRLSREVIRAEGLVTHVSIPLVARDHVVGVLNVAANTPRDFRDEEARLLCSLGRQVGVAVDNARLWDQVRRKEYLRGQLLERLLGAQEEERRRISLELHDQTGGSLASLGVGLRMLEDSAPLPSAARDHVRELKKQVEQIALDLHRLALELRPPALDRLGLADAVEQSVHHFARQHDLTADFQAIGLDGERLPAEVETALYRIVQEALTNIAKHARASEVGVVLERRSDSVVAVIEDNGCGFDVAQALADDEGHLGLFGMQERAALVGGHWQVESTPGQGTTVFVEVPIRHQ